jgi:hypothetical protein
MSVDDAQFNELVQVGRVSHELSARHGRNAFSYAERLQTQAEADSRSDEAKFWAKVAAALRPREQERLRGDSYDA